MALGFGLDLAGYSTGKSSLAVAQNAQRSISLCVLENSPFETVRALGSLRAEVEREERDCLLLLLELGNVAVDVPIDLQGLPHHPTSSFLWGQTKRPIDYALKAMPPFADRIGSVVSRFQSIIKGTSAIASVGARLFETYPAASLVALGHTGKGYKRPDATAARQEVAEHLNFDSGTLSDDELDALICALTALGPSVLEGESLRRFVNSRSKTPLQSLPDGYRLLARVPQERISVTRASFADWTTRRAHQ